MGDSSDVDIQWGSFQLSIIDDGLEIEIASTTLIDQPHDASNEQIGANDVTSTSLLISNHDSIKQEVGTKVVIFTEDSSISKIQWGSIELTDQHDALKEQIEVNDITFPKLSSLTRREHSLGFQKHKLVKKVKNEGIEFENKEPETPNKEIQNKSPSMDIAIESKESKTSIKKIQNKSPSMHIAIENEESKSTSHAKNLGSTYGWEVADPPKIEIINVLKLRDFVSTKNIYQRGTMIGNKLMTTTTQGGIDPINSFENEVLPMVNVSNVMVESSKEKMCSKTIDLKDEGDAIEKVKAKGEEEILLWKAMRKEKKKERKANKRTIYLFENGILPRSNVLNEIANKSKEDEGQKTKDLKDENDAIERAKVRDQEENLILKTTRKEKKRRKKTYKKTIQKMNLVHDSNHVDYASRNKFGCEDEGLVAEQAKVNSAQEQQRVRNSRSHLKATMEISFASTLDRIVQKLLAFGGFFPKTLVVSCNVAFIGIVLLIFVYIVLSNL